MNFAPLKLGLFDESDPDGGRARVRGWVNNFVGRFFAKKGVLKSILSLFEILVQEGRT